MSSMAGSQDESFAARGQPVRARRHRVVLQGRIVAGPQLYSCVIRDLSREGAKIHVLATITLPDCFELLIAADDLRREQVRLRWRRGDFAGLSFVTTRRS